MSMLSGRFVVLAVALGAASASAGIEQAPPGFPFSGRGLRGEAVYVDFESARYSIVYDFAAKRVRVESDIEFTMPKAGFPIFDLIPTPTDVRLDGEAADARVTADPDGESRFQIVARNALPGRHRLTMKHAIATNVSFRDSGVASAFWMSDLNDRQFLEQYLPTSFEYDQYAMTMRVEIAGADGVEHVLRANGVVTAQGRNRFEAVFPAGFTTSSVFYHLMPKHAVSAKVYEYRSIDGRALPVEIYTPAGVDRFAGETNRVLAELEAAYGPFPHPKLVIYGAGQGGMEYSGATMTSFTALGHELFHSYNARGVMPAAGNAGWIDEAMSSWRDSGYPTRSSPGGETRMAGHSKWARMTDRDAYTEGAQFLAWIAGRMEARGKSLQAFFREYFAENLFKTATTESFRAQLEAYSGMDFAGDFERYVYGRSSRERTSSGSSWKGAKAAAEAERTRLGANEACDLPVAEESIAPSANPYHPQLTEAQQLELLWP